MEILEYSDERLIPEKAELQPFWEHIHRYRFAVPFARGQRVLDVACGEGYGTAALAKSGAASVMGMDIAEEVCGHAAKKYGVRTMAGDAQRLALGSGSVDLVVSFETIEHLPEPERFLNECARVLGPGGRAVISTPNRELYRSGKPKNPYHVRELNQAEFLELLEARFKEVRLYTQRLLWGPWWSCRGLASEYSIWQRVPGLGRVRRRLQLACCPEVARPGAFERARQDPVGAILARHRRGSALINPFSIRPLAPGSKDKSVYFLAVATK